MKVNGEVKDAIHEKPLPDVKVRIYVGEKELAALYSNREGRFEFKEAASYIDKTLTCQIEKEGFKPQKVTYKIGQEEIQLDIELVSLMLPPKKKKPIERQKPTRKIWPFIAGGVGGVAIIAIVVFIILKVKPTEDTTLPKIKISIKSESTNSSVKQHIRFVAEAQDNVGIEQIIIIIDDNQVKSCNTSKCEYLGGPYDVGTKLRFGAIAYDKAGNNKDAKPVEVVIKRKSYEKYYMKGQVLKDFKLKSETIKRALPRRALPR